MGDQHTDLPTNQHVQSDVPSFEGGIINVNKFWHPIIKTWNSDVF